MLQRLLISAVVLLTVSGCIADSVPKGYSGPIAYITDSMGSHGGSGIDFFYLDKLNGRKIYQSLAATTQANQGNGFSMEPVMIKRDVPAQTATFTIIGRTHFAAPIQELSNKVYQVAGDVTFTPAPDASYVVKGTLGPGYSAVWIEGKSGAVMGKKIEIQGDATLNFLEK